MTAAPAPLEAEPSASAPARRPARHRGIGELIVDLVIVVGSALYVWTAQSYPPAGREIPTVVGVIALAVGIVQIVGWFVPRLWTVTHGNPSADPAKSAAPAAAADSTAAAAPADAAADERADATRRQQRDTAIVVAWAAGFVVAILVLGYRYAVPLFFLAYFGARKQWRLAIASAVVMYLLTQFVFIDLLGINLPSSQFFVF